MKYNIIIILLAFALFTRCEEIEEGQIEESFYLKNEGAEMPVFVRGNAEATKTLVIVHGGPGGSSLRHYYQIPEFTSTMEEDYLLVYWEQRGSGISSGKLDDDDFTLDKMTDDLDKLLKVISHKYGTDKEFFLLGQSFGSLLTGQFISSEYVQEHNVAGWITIGGLYSFKDYAPFMHAYISQFLDLQTDPGWDEIKAKMREIDAEESTLRSITDWNSLGDEMQLKAVELGQANERQVTDMGGLFSPGYNNTLTRLINNLNGGTRIFHDIYNLDLKEDLKNANTPALFLAGEHDYLTPRNYGDSLMMFYGHPDKQHIVFPRGTHNVIATDLIETIEVMSEFMETH